MVFSSVLFLSLFLPVILTVYFILPRKTHNIFLLFISLFFYAWAETKYLFILLFCIAINYIFGLKIDKSDDKAAKKRLIIGAVVINLGVLAVYKYLNFFLFNLNGLLLQLDFPVIAFKKVHLPIGISFFTFQAMSYVIDVYRKNIPVQKSFTKTALYISLFPQLVAGPIIRYKEIADQLTQRLSTISQFEKGIRRFVIGLGKKVLIADVLAGTADHIFALPPEYITFQLAWLGVICFTLQIYFDFSGYSDMAIGLGHLFGFTFPENFNYPYIAQSVTDFWRRWHISLTNWFRDYLFLPTYFKRRKWGKWAMPYALFVNFALIGLWHGAGWNFLIWGLFNGVFLILENLKIINVDKMRFSFLKWLYTMLVFMIGVTIFRADSMSLFFCFFKAMFGFADVSSSAHALRPFLDNLTVIMILVGIAASTPVGKNVFSYAEKALIRNDNRAARACKPVFYFNYSFSLLGLLVFCFIRLAAYSHTPFIYFRF